MEGEIKNIIYVCLSIIASLGYCYFICSKIPKGFYRFVSLLPIFSLFTILPLSLSSAFSTAVTALFITWLANLKLLLFAFDGAPLYPPKSLILFITLASFPIKIRSNGSRQSSKPKSKSKSNLKPLNLAVEVLAFAILMSLLFRYKDLLHPTFLLLFYCCLVFLLVDILVAFSSAIVWILVGLELEPPSDEPYLSTSLQDFWGRRWNLMVSNTLRHTVFEPVRTACGPILGNDWAPIPAVLASFAVSGLMHELLFFYVTRDSHVGNDRVFRGPRGLCCSGV
ncbi:hypothetical protein LguiA_035668 [Lonicera macranthoides]